MEDLDEVLEEDSVASQKIIWIEEFRARQREQKKKRGRDLTIDDLVSLQDSPPSPTRPITPPGPPCESTSSASKVPLEERSHQPPPQIKKGVMFEGLKIIPTDPSLDPPSGVCLSCWERGHIRRQCPTPYRGNFCSNCVRRGVILTSCPCCAEVHTKDMRSKFGTKAHMEHRMRREEFYTEKYKGVWITKGGKIYPVPDQ